MVIPQQEKQFLQFPQLLGRWKPSDIVLVLIYLFLFLDVYLLKILLIDHHYFESIASPVAASLSSERLIGIEKALFEFNGRTRGMMQFDLPVSSSLTNSSQERTSPQSDEEKTIKESTNIVASQQQQQQQQQQQPQPRPAPSLPRIKVKQDLPIQYRKIGATKAAPLTADHHRLPPSLHDVTHSQLNNHANRFVQFSHHLNHPSVNSHPQSVGVFVEASNAVNLDHSFPKPKPPHLRNYEGQFHHHEQEKSSPLRLPISEEKNLSQPHSQPLTHEQHKNCSRLDVYSIIQQESAADHHKIKDFLTSQHISYHRIEAVQFKDIKRKNVLKEANIYNSKVDDLNSIIAHLYAMYRATHDPDQADCAYALIMEESSEIHFNISSWFDLINNAPPDFMILQIAPTSDELMEKLWKDYQTSVESATDPTERIASSLWARIKPSKDAIWSSAGFIINKSKVKQELTRYLQVKNNQIEKVRFTAPRDVDCHVMPCLLPFPIVTGVYFFLLFQPTYAIKIPLISERNRSDGKLKELLVNHKTAFPDYMKANPL